MKGHEKMELEKEIKRIVSMDVDGVEVPKEPSTFVEMNNMLAQQSKATADEKNAAYEKAKSMTLEELQEEALNTPTNYQEGKLNHVSDETVQKLANPNKKHSIIDDLNPDEIMKVIDLACKCKADPSYNILPEIPEKIFAVINLMCKANGLGAKATAAMAKEFILEVSKEFGEDSLDKEFNKFLKSINEVDELMFALPSAMQANEKRKEFEIKLKEMAKDESLPEDKRKVMIDTSNAYRDSYTLARQINLLKEDGILDKLDKLLNKRKKFERMCDDFNFVVNATVTKPIDIKEAAKVIPYILKVSEAQARIFILTLCLLTKNVTKENTSEVFFMYSSYFNIVSLASSKNLVNNDIVKEEDKEIVDFVQERVEYVRTFFETLEKAVATTRNAKAEYDVEK